MSTLSRSPILKESRRAAWGMALAIWLLGCVVLGYLCFVVAGRRLKAMADPFWAAVWWQLSFAVGLALVHGAIVIANRSRGMTLRDLGWRKPTSSRMLGAGVVLGLMYVAGVYGGITQDPSMRGINPFAFHWVRLALIPVGLFMAFVEETMMRGFFMTQLSKAGVGTGLQILLSGACSGVYHALHNWTLIGFAPGFILFTLHAALYVAAGRSLTPTIVAHSLYHILCAPYLLMFAMAQTPG